jgi:hypothetical protein
MATNAIRLGGRRWKDPAVVRKPQPKVSTRYRQPAKRRERRSDAVDQVASLVEHHACVRRNLRIDKGLQIKAPQKLLAVALRRLATRREHLRAEPIMAEGDFERKAGRIDPQLS